MTMIAVAAALAFGTAAPEPAPAPAPMNVPVQQRVAQDINPETDTRRVCIIDRASGAGLSRRYCQARATWVAQGTDPLAKR